MRTYGEHPAGTAEPRLGTLRRWQILRACCPACGHRGVLDVGALRRRWGAATPVQRLEARLRCRNCGNASGNLVEIGCHPRNSDLGL
jgi:hypothetical protein